MSINPADIIIHIINVGVLYVILRFLVYTPVLNFMKTRRERVEGRLEEAEQKNREAEELREKYEAQLNDAKAEAEKLAEAEVSAAREEADRILEEADRRVNALVTGAKKKVREDNAAAMKEMRDEVKEISVDIAEKILCREVRASDNERIVDRFFSDRGQNHE